MGKTLTVIFSDHSIVTETNCTTEIHSAVIALSEKNDEEGIKQLLVPKFLQKQEEVKEEIKNSQEIINVIESLPGSSILTYEGKMVYIKSISDLSVPKELVVAINKAEQEGNQELIQTYLNFWTLASLNPDAEARKNMFWFLSRYGFKVTKSGLFVAYRNVNILKEDTEKSSKKIDNKLVEFLTATYVKVKSWKKSPKSFTVLQLPDGEYSCIKDSLVDEKSLEDDTEILGNLKDLYDNLSAEKEENQEKDTTPTYTDAHTGKFRIKIGKMVSMPREDCDERQDVTCSRGLHVAGKQWLESQGSSFGKVGLAVFVNPADVVAVPPSDDYGKMRVCAYYPIKIVQKDKNNKIIEDDLSDGFEDDFFSQISYSGEVSNKDTGLYKIEIPKIPQLNKDNIVSRLDEIKANLKKYVN